MVSTTTVTESVETTGLEILEKGFAEVMLTVRCVNRWQNLRCVVSERKDNLLLLHPADPQDAQDDSIAQLTPGAQVGGTFRHHGHKYTFVTCLRQRTPLSVDGLTTWLIVVDFPKQVEQGSRRVHPRTVSLTLGEVRCLVWSGGPATEPESEDPSAPAWAGNVLDMSRGGICMCVERSARDLLAVGDRVGGRMQSSATGRGCRFEARVCHIERFSVSQDSIGLQFTETPVGVDGAGDGSDFA